MIIKKENLSVEAYRNILIENILRNADQFQGDLDREIKKADLKIITGEWSLLYSKSKNNVTIIESKLLKK